MASLIVVKSDMRLENNNFYLAELCFLLFSLLQTMKLLLSLVQALSLLIL